MKMTGLDKVQKQLRDLARRAKELQGTHNVLITDLLTSVFVRKYTKFDSVDAMFEASGFTIESAEDFKAIPDDEWNTFISQVSRFSSWEEMLQEAGAEYFGNKLRLS